MAETLQLVALERGFYKSRLIHPGTKFAYPADKKVPKWAAPAEVAAVKPAKPLGGDTKPLDTQAAVKAKAEGTAKL